MRKQFLAASVMLLAGCQTTPAPIVFKPGVDLAATGAAIDQCKIASLKEIPQSMATDYRPGFSTPGTIQCNTYGTMTTCNRIGAVNIPPSATTYDVNGDLRDRYIARCLEGQGFQVNPNGHRCASETESKQAIADRAAGKLPSCALPLY